MSQFFSLLFILQLVSLLTLSSLPQVVEAVRQPCTGEDAPGALDVQRAHPDAHEVGFCPVAFKGGNEFFFHGIFLLAEANYRLA